MRRRAPARACAALISGLFALAVAAPAAAEPALWKVQGPHATVYLFGTVHLLKNGTVWRTPKIDAAFGPATALWEEIANADDAAAAQPLMFRYGVDPAHPLSTVLDDTGKAKLAAFETTYGLPPAAIDPMRPWFAAVSLGVIPIVKAGYDPKTGVDLTLKSMAAQQSKPVSGSETLEQQIRFFADLPQQLQVDYLLFTLDSAATSVAQVDQLVDAWAAGDTAKLQALLNVGLLQKYPELYRVLLVQRNRGMATQIETLLKGDGVTFVAVGAGHLVGPDSIQADLAKDGIQAVRQ